MNSNCPDDKIVFEARVKALEASARVGGLSHQVIARAAQFEDWLLRPRGK